jgi:hypothetical protein
MVCTDPQIPPMQIIPCSNAMSPCFEAKSPFALPIKPTPNDAINANKKKKNDINVGILVFHK